ncbi:MAG: heme-binding domain-containing protein [Draconibacterium sp.]
MNKKQLFSGITAALLFASVLVEASNVPSKSEFKNTSKEIDAIIQKSCYGCHNSESKNDKAKDKLDFKTFESLSKPDKIHALREIGDVLKDDDMPPKKFLERFPDKALTKDEKKALMDWAKKEAKEAMK